MSDEKTNMCEPLLTHRKNKNDGIETGGVQDPRDEGAPCGRSLEPGSCLRVALAVSGV